MVDTMSNEAAFPTLLAPAAHFIRYPSRKGRGGAKDAKGRGKGVVVSQILVKQDES